MARGTVKWFNDAGAEVEFDTQQGPKGLSAENVRTV